ncbi:MAG: hypothetical protein C4329_15440 [Chitinophagaceae bacterium]
MLQPFIILQVIVIVGVLGFITIEKYNLLEALYMTTISITTAGFQEEVRPLSNEGRASSPCSFY